MTPFLDGKASLAEDATQTEVAKLAAWVIRERPIRQCRAFARELEQRVAAGALSENVAAFYEQIIHRLRFVAFTILNDERLQEALFEKGVAEALADENIDVQGRIHAYLIELNVPDRDPLKKQWREALLRNTQALTDVSFVDRTGVKTVGTVQQWLKAYRGISEEPLPSKLEEATFFSTDRNFRALNVFEQETVKKLFSLFTSLSRSSMTIEGIEEDIVFEEDGVLKELNKQTYRVEEVFPKKQRSKSSVKVSAPPTLPELRAAAERGQKVENLEKVYFDEATKTFQWKEE